MTPNQVLSSYEKIVELTGRMVDAARNDDWDDFSLLEDQCALQSKHMLESMMPTLSGAASQRKVELLKQILANDREIRSITEPWADQVANVMKAAPAPRPEPQQAVC